MAALTAAMLALAAASTVTTLASKGPSAPQLPAMPTAPDPVLEAQKADAAARAAAGGPRPRSAIPGPRSTILTGPVGVSAPAPVAYKTLLGQ